MLPPWTHPRFPPAGGASLFDPLPERLGTGLQIRADAFDSRVGLHAYDQDMTWYPSGGCIRLYDEGPEWHINPEHVTVGLFDTSHAPRIDSSGFLVIDLVNPDGSGVNTWPVIAMHGGPDETLSARHITAGCSNGGPVMRIRLTHKDLGPLNLTRADHYAIVAGAYSNLWPEAAHDAP